MQILQHPWFLTDLPPGALQMNDWYMQNAPVLDPVSRTVLHYAMLRGAVLCCGGAVRRKYRLCMQGCSGWCGGQAHVSVLGGRKRPLRLLPAARPTPGAPWCQAMACPGERPHSHRPLPQPVLHFFPSLQIVMLIDEIVGLAAREGIPGDPPLSCPFQPLHPPGAVAGSGSGSAAPAAAPGGDVAMQGAGAAR